MHKQKTCRKCGEIKKLGQFPRLHSGYGDGHINTCKECERAWKRQNYLENRERRIETSAQWAARNRERVNANLRRWKKRNWKKVKMWNRLYDLKYPEKRKEKLRKYRESIRETSDGTVTPRAMDDLCRKQEYLCKICKKDISKGRERDHIIPLSKGGKHTISNMQWLCRPCNRKKADKILS